MRTIIAYLILWLHVIFVRSKPRYKIRTIKRMKYFSGLKLKKLVDICYKFDFYFYCEDYQLYYEISVLKERIRENKAKRKIIKIIRSI